MPAIPLRSAEPDHIFAAMSLKPVSSNTIAEMIADGTTVTLYCHNPKCHHRAPLDLVKLRDRLGPDQTLLIDDVRERFRCGKCGSKDIGIIKSPYHATSDRLG